jgi:restriction endonuclease S subunit
MRFLGYLYGGLTGKSANDFNQIGNIENKYFIPFTNIANNTRIDLSKLQEVIISDGENQNQAKKGDLFFLMSSENYEDVGKSAVLSENVEDLYLNSFCKGFRITAQSINSEFLNYQLQSREHRHNLLTEANGFTRINLKIDKANGLFVAIPPLPEQTAIASFLDQKTAEIDQLIADKKRLIELYEEEKTAIINQAVTKGIDPDVKMKESGIEWLGKIPEHWEVKRLKYYFDLITEKKNNDIKKIGLENIESKTGKFIESYSDFEGEGIFLKKNDILFGKLRPYLAKVWLAEFDGQAVGDFYILRSKSNILPSLAKYRLLSSSFIEISNNSTYGAKMPRVNWDFLADLSIAFPKIEEQRLIADYIETECSRINTKIEKTKKLINLLSEYRTTLISEVVTGKIKVI